MPDDGQITARRMMNDGACLYFKLTYQPKGSGDWAEKAFNSCQIQLIFLNLLKAFQKYWNL